MDSDPRDFTPVSAIDDQRTAAETRDAAEFDTEIGAYRTSFDSTSESASRAVVSTVAAVSNSTPMQLEPLYSVVDPDALDTVVESTVSRPPDPHTHVTFSFNGYEVTVHSYGTVVVREAEGG